MNNYDLCLDLINLRKLVKQSVKPNVLSPVFSLTRDGLKVNVACETRISRGDRRAGSVQEFLQPEKLSSGTVQFPARYTLVACRAATLTLFALREARKFEPLFNDVVGWEQRNDVTIPSIGLPLCNVRQTFNFDEWIPLRFRVLRNCFLRDILFFSFPSWKMAVGSRASTHALRLDPPRRRFLATWLFQQVSRLSSNDFNLAKNSHRGKICLPLLRKLLPFDSSRGKPR